MAAVGAAQALMDSEWRSGAHYREHRLRLDFAPREEGPGAGPAADLDLDWLCPACRALNFARRAACYQCAAPRGADAEAVRPDAPSHVLRVSNLEPGTSE